MLLKRYGIPTDINRYSSIPYSPKKEIAERSLITIKRAIKNENKTHNKYSVYMSIMIPYLLCSADIRISDSMHLNALFRMELKGRISDRHTCQMINEF